MTDHFVSACCNGEKCSICDHPAEHKIEEAILLDDPDQSRHPLTCYVCHYHFQEMMSPGEMRKLFEDVAKTALPEALVHLRTWTSYIDEDHRTKYADLMESQARLIGWLLSHENRRR